MEIKITIVPDQGQATSRDFADPVAAVDYLVKLVPMNAEKRTLEWRSVPIRREQTAGTDAVIPTRRGFNFFGGSSN